MYNVIKNRKPVADKTVNIRVLPEKEVTTMKKSIRAALCALLFVIMIVQLLPFDVYADSAPHVTVWEAVEALEQTVGEPSEQAFAQLFPQIESTILSHPDYESGTLERRGGMIFWRSNGHLNGYDPKQRADLYSDSGAPTREAKSYIRKNPEASGASEYYGALSGAPLTDGVRDICVFLPYAGTKKDFYAQYEALGERLADYTGGDLICWQGTEASVTRLAAALEECAVVIIGTHGASPGGFIGLTTDAGFDDSEKETDHLWSGGRHTKTVNSQTVFDYDLWCADGTAITDHMTKNAPNNLVICSSCCMSMKTDSLCAPLREKGVAAVYGYSESISIEGGTMWETEFIEALCRRCSVSEAFEKMRTVTNCWWDPIWRDCTLADAQHGGMAFPYIVSDEDAYPADGTSVIQHPNCGWKLPVRTDVPEKRVVALGRSYSDFVIAETKNTVTNVSVAAGALPSGMQLSTSGGKVSLTGTPDKKGYTVATLKITTDKKEEFRKPVGIMTADYDNITKTLTNETVDAEAVDKWTNNTYVWTDDDEKHNVPYQIPLHFETSYGTYTAELVSGFMPPSLEYCDTIAKGLGFVQSRTSRYRPDFYTCTSPGVYTFGIDFITMGGEVFRCDVILTVKPHATYTAKAISLSYMKYDEISYNIPTEHYNSSEKRYELWSAGAVSSVRLTGGELPPGVILTNSWHKPFGIYGEASVPGDYNFTCRMATSNDYYDYTFNVHIDEPAIKIKGSVKHAGDLLELELHNVPDNYTLQWQRSTDKENWENVSRAADASYHTNQGDARYYFRARISSEDYDRDHYSDIRFVNPLPELEGSIVYSSGVVVGRVVSTGENGALRYLCDNYPERVHFTWSKSDDGFTNWKPFLKQDRTSAFTPTPDLAGKYIRVMAEADGYTGAVSGTSHIVSKQKCTDEPVQPFLSMSDDYGTVTVTNAKTDQEYALSYSETAVAWSGAEYPEEDGALSFDCQKDTVVYIHTRIRETDSSYGGEKTVYSKIYSGHTTFLTGLTLNESRVLTKVGEVTRLTASPLPEDFSGWNDAYSLTWFVNGYGVTLYADEQCTVPIETSTPVANKTVYMKGTVKNSNLTVGVEKQVGLTDIRFAMCSVEVADAEGFRELLSVDFEEATLRAGETVTVSYAPAPEPSRVGNLSFWKQYDTSPDFEITDNEDGTLTVTAPDDAPEGTYFYNVFVNHHPTPNASALKVTVPASSHTVKLLPDNGTDQYVMYAVADGGELILPGLPDEFDIPDGCDFDGWDVGRTGDSVIVYEDMIITAKWIGHTHIVRFVEGYAPSCLLDGMTEHYYCEECLRVFFDEACENEAPNDDYFVIPATGHIHGEPVVQPVKEPDCENDGSYYEIVNCEECGAELTREIKNIPALGHDWGAPSYRWSSDLSTVTAERVCMNDATHKETETAAAVVTDHGDHKEYTAEFINPAFEKQSKTTKGLMYGDVDLDGEITAADALIILRASAGLEEFDEMLKTLGDVDFDGSITASDALAVLRYSAGLSEEV